MYPIDAFAGSELQHCRGTSKKVHDFTDYRPPCCCADTYVHRSGRTGRAGRAGVAVTLYADNETNDIRKIEYGVGQGFKFERGAVPSAEQVMSLAGTVAREQIKGVSEEMVGYFVESAQELLAEETSEVRNVMEEGFVFVCRRCRGVVAQVVGVAWVVMLSA